MWIPEGAWLVVAARLVLSEFVDRLDDRPRQRPCAHAAQLRLARLPEPERRSDRLSFRLDLLLRQHRLVVPEDCEPQLLRALHDRDPAQLKIPPVHREAAGERTGRLAELRAMHLRERVAVGVEQLAPSLARRVIVITESPGQRGSRRRCVSSSSTGRHSAGACARSSATASLQNAPPTATHRVACRHSGSRMTPFPRGKNPRVRSGSCLPRL